VSPLRIPSEHQAGLVKLYSLTDETASALRSALASAAVEKESAELSAEDIEPIEGLAPAILDQILEVITGLHHARAYADVPLEEFVNDVSGSIRSTTERDFPTTGPALDRFKDRLKAFLAIDAIARAAKSNIVRYEQERTVHGVRILTDARPIFGNNVEEPPEAIAIIHTLKIAYHRSGRLEEEFFAFDEHDLKELKNAVERAELKANSLRAVLTKSHLKVLTEE
jgi:hypothetical protein